MAEHQKTMVARLAQADICQLGMDQRKVNVLAREYCDVCKPKRKLKPIILSHPMMPGLLVVRQKTTSKHRLPDLAIHSTS